MLIKQIGSPIPFSKFADCMYEGTVVYFGKIDLHKMHWQTVIVENNPYRFTDLKTDGFIDVLLYVDAMMWPDPYTDERSEDMFNEHIYFAILGKINILEFHNLEIDIGNLGALSIRLFSPKEKGMYEIYDNDGTGWGVIEVKDEDVQIVRIAPFTAEDMEMEMNKPLEKRNENIQLELW